MMPYAHLVSEVKVLGVAAGAMVALFVEAPNDSVGNCVYVLCVALLAMSVGGGIFFDRYITASRNFFIWSVVTLVISTSLVAVVCYFSLAVFGTTVSLWINVVSWLVMLSGFAWLFFVRRYERMPAYANANAIGGASVLGACLGGIAVLLPEDAFLAIISFLTMSLFGVALSVLLMAHLRELLEFRPPAESKQLK